MIKKSIEQVLTVLYDNNLHLFKKGYFQVQYKSNDFRVCQVDGSYEGSFLTLIHYILFYEKLYEDYFSAKSVKLAARVIKNEPGLPPAFDSERDNDNFDEFVFDATKFTYQYMKDHKLYCEEMNVWIENTEQDWKPLKKSAKKEEAIVGVSKKATPKSIFKSTSIKKIDNFFNSVSKK